MLSEADLVRVTPSGRHVWYELAGVPLLDAQRWIDGLVHRAAGPTRIDGVASPTTRHRR